MNPVEEFLSTRQGMEKDAGWLSNLWTGLKAGVRWQSPEALTKSLKGTGLSAGAVRGITESGATALGATTGKLLSAGTAAAGIEAGVRGAVSGGRALKAKFDKPKQYKAMLAAHPTLRTAPASQVQAYYNALNAVAPSIAAEPMLAGSFVRNVIAKGAEGGPAVPLDTTKMLVDIQKNITSGREDIPSPLRSLTGLRLAPDKLS